MITYSEDYSFDNDYSNRDRPVITRLFILALLVSCSLHFLLLLLFPEWRLWKPLPAAKISTMQISIQPLIEPEIEKPQKQIQTNQEISDPKIVTQKAVERRSEVVTTSTQAPVILPKRIEMLTPEELNNIKVEKSAEFLPQDNLAFNPALKKGREIRRAMPKGGASKPDTVETWQDIHGTRFYKSDSRCYKALTEARGISSTEKGTNWYFTSCDGKSESEKITDRINQEMKEKFRH